MRFIGNMSICNVISFIGTSCRRDMLIWVELGCIEFSRTKYLISFNWFENNSNNRSSLLTTRHWSIDHFFPLTSRFLAQHSQTFLLTPKHKKSYIKYQYYTQYVIVHNINLITYNKPTNNKYYIGENEKCKEQPKRRMPDGNQKNTIKNRCNHVSNWNIIDAVNAENKSVEVNINVDLSEWWFKRKWRNSLLVWIFI